MKLEIKAQVASRHEALWILRSYAEYLERNIDSKAELVTPVHNQSGVNIGHMYVLDGVDVQAWLVLQRLYDAAPDMLTALSNWCAAFGAENGLIHTETELAAYQTAKAAIAKARGQ